MGAAWHWRPVLVGTRSRTRQSSWLLVNVETFITRN
jgi:hypothetical protein